MRERFVFHITLNGRVFFCSFFPTPVSSLQQIYLNIFLKEKHIPYFWAVQVINIHLLFAGWLVPVMIRGFCGASPSLSHVAWREEDNLVLERHPTQWKWGCREWRESCPLGRGLWITSGVIVWPSNCLSAYLRFLCFLFIYSLFSVKNETWKFCLRLIFFVLCRTVSSRKTGHGLLIQINIWFKLYSMWYKFEHFTILLIFVKSET